MSVLDRLPELRAQSHVTGIDFIYVHADQQTLEVHFLRPPATLNTPLTGALGPDDIRIYSPSGDAPDVPVALISWIMVDGEDILRLVTAFPGDFALYKIKIDDLRLDPYYNDVTFDFKANCPSDFDCEPPEHECPPETLVDFPVDYSARDFWSFRQALLEFAAQRYPDWPDRLEADLGIMLVEVMSALGDEMAYYQDRVAREAYLETATQRRSLRRHARLVDYHLHDGLGATTWLSATVDTDGDIKAGSGVWAASDNGTLLYFETGKNIEEILAEKPYPVRVSFNQFQPHIWNKDQTCLPVGTTMIDVKKKPGVSWAFDDQIEGKPGQVPGKWVLLQTTPANAAQPARAHFVRVVGISDLTDPVLNDAPITRLVWEQDQALPFEMDLTVLTVCGNILPAVAGKTLTQFFVVKANPDRFSPIEWQAIQETADLPRKAYRAVEREGCNGYATYLFTLPDSDQLPLVWLGKSPQEAVPEIVLWEMKFDGTKWTRKKWDWKKSLLGVNSSQPQNTHFTFDDGSWRRVVGYQRIGETVVHQDYAANAGVTVRFGDGEFGFVPVENTVFRVDYRIGSGRRGNVAADALQKHAIPGVVQVTNPLPAINGMDAETADELRQMAPEAFRAVTYRAVRPEDYAEAAQRLPWVQRAGATFRWTGSWLSAFVTPDPQGTAALEEKRRLELVRQLDRFRQAGREAHVMNPIYANMDIEIDVCVTPDAYSGEVKVRVLEVLLGKKGLFPKPGYFAADNFTFGTPLDRSTLEAAIQAVPGVRAVENIRFQRRGWFQWQTFKELSYSPGENAIIRIENDPLHPGNGTLKLYTHGGA